MEVIRVISFVLSAIAFCAAVTSLVLTLTRIKKLVREKERLGGNAKFWEERAEKISKSILTLIFAGILPNSESDKCFKKLQKQIVKKLKPID